VEDLSILYARRRKGEEITEYVYRENEALLSREISGLKTVIASIDDIALERYGSVGALAAGVDDMIQKKVVEYEDPEAVYGIAKRKLLKVLRYVDGH